MKDVAFPVQMLYIKRLEALRICQAPSPRSSVDRAPASGAGSMGSSPVGGARKIYESRRNAAHTK